MEVAVALRLDDNLISRLHVPSLHLPDHFQSFGRQRKGKGLVHIPCRSSKIRANDQRFVARVGELGDENHPVEDTVSYIYIHRSVISPKPGGGGEEDEGENRQPRGSPEWEIPTSSYAHKRTFFLGEVSTDRLVLAPNGPFRVGDRSNLDKVVDLSIGRLPLVAEGFSYFERGQDGLRVAGNSRQATVGL